MFRSAFRAIGSIILAVAMLTAIVGTASAHDHREVGKYELTVGWTGEPAYVGERNGIDFRVMNTETDEPVEGLAETVKAEISFGGQKRELTLRPVFGQVGRYTADVLPTRVGDYQFRFFGEIEGMALDETFDSADGGFSAVEEIQGIQFPEAIPSAGETAQAALAAEQRAAIAESLAQEAMGSGQTMAIAGVVLGALGTVLGGVGLLGRSRRSAS